MKLATKRKDDMFHIAVTTIGKIGLTCLTVKGTLIQDATATWWKGGPRVLGPFYWAIILYPSSAEDFSLDPSFWPVLQCLCLLDSSSSK